MFSTVTLIPTSHGHSFAVSSELQVQENKKNEDTKKPTGAEPERDKGKTGIKEDGLVLVNVCT